MSGDLKGNLASALKGVTKDWKKAKKREDRVHASNLDRMRAPRPYRLSIRDAAFEAMEPAWAHASSDDRYRAHARQVMYSARPLVLRFTGGECWKSSAYFTQTLLKDYIEKYNPPWRDLIVWDARGHLLEPHTGREVALGGYAVASYVGSWTNGKVDTTPVSTLAARLDTKGPHHRFRAALFIEKEGFDEILRAAGIAERYDLAIYSTKGVPVGAACTLSHELHSQGVKILVAHDFDVSGFKIVQTLRRGTRLAPATPAVIDIGLRLPDVHEMDLQSEPVTSRQETSPRRYLRQCGATDEEQEFLVARTYHRGWMGARVELNAMTSEQLIDWLESKLTEHGVQKVVPDDATLAHAYRRAAFRRELEQAAQKLAADPPVVEVPADLRARVVAHLDSNPAASWDDAVAAALGQEKDR